jgi:hypothetical protein
VLLYEGIGSPFGRAGARGSEVMMAAVTGEWSVVLKRGREDAQQWSVKMGAAASDVGPRS